MSPPPTPSSKVKKGKKIIIILILIKKNSTKERTERQNPGTDRVMTYSRKKKLCSLYFKDRQGGAKHGIIIRPSQLLT